MPSFNGTVMRLREEQLPTALCSTVSSPLGKTKSINCLQFLNAPHQMVLTDGIAILLNEWQSANARRSNVSSRFPACRQVQHPSGRYIQHVNAATSMTLTPSNLIHLSEVQ
jgi:hypothetical protein